MLRCRVIRNSGWRWKSRNPFKGIEEFPNCFIDQQHSAVFLPGIKGKEIQLQHKGSYNTNPYLVAGLKKWRGKKASLMKRTGTGIKQFKKLKMQDFREIFHKGAFGVTSIPFNRP